MRLSQAFEGFRLTRLAEGYSENTLEVYEWAISRLAKFLDDPEVQDITYEQLQEFVGWLRTKYKPNRPNKKDDSPLSGSSVENAWKAIRSFYNWASKGLKIEARPDQGLVRPKYTKFEIKPYTEAEVRAILKASERRSVAPGNRRAYSCRRPTALRDRALILVLLDTGLRASECARLKIGDVDFRTGEVRIQAWGSGQKTKARFVYLEKTSKQAVWKYLAERKEAKPLDPLFATDDLCHPMDRTSIRRVISGLGSKAGVGRAGPHRFRHTFAVQYLRNGGDIFTLQRLLGHSTLEMVRIYLQLADTDDASAHRRASPADNWDL